MKKRNCIIGQSGGPTVAINATLAGIISKAKQSGEYENIYGMINGIQGLIERRIFNLLDEFTDESKIEDLKTTPAMYLGSCRFKLADHNQDDSQFQKIIVILQELEITDFFYIGGNDSMDTVMKLNRYAKFIGIDINFIGLPKTIDNDLFGTDHTPGFGSAAKYVATSMLEVVHDSSIYDLPSITIVEVMGRNAGWLTAASALSRNGYNTAPDLIYLPEVTFDKDRFLADIENLMKTKRFVVVAVSEGIRDEQGNYLDADSRYVKKDAFGHILHSGTGKVLETLIYNRFHCKVRSIELNVLQRCAMHIASKSDLDESFNCGIHAIECALNNLSGQVVSMKRVDNNPYAIEYTHKDVETVANLEQKMPRHFINDQGNDITQDAIDYLKPLIQGEVMLKYENGIPTYLSCKHLL